MTTLVSAASSILHGFRFLTLTKTTSSSSENFGVLHLEQVEQPEDDRETADDDLFIGVTSCLTALIVGVRSALAVMRFGVTGADV